MALKKNQINQVNQVNQVNQGLGGRREGAGRKKGSTKKPQISDFITEREVKELVKIAKTQAKDKPDLLKFLLEQVFGRARQNIGLDGGEDDKPINIISYGNDTGKIPTKRLSNSYK